MSTAQHDTEQENLRIAVIGSGVAGLTSAWQLQRRHQVDLYERNARPGGHTRTFVVPSGEDEGTPIDTGFIVMNHRNYPVLTRIFEQLGVELDDSDMSFSYHAAGSSYEYAGNNLRSLFAHPLNALRPSHWRMIRDILRFNREAREDHDRGRLKGVTLGAYLAGRRYTEAFTDRYLYAMGSAIWSAPAKDVADFPAEAYIHFFVNHGLLDLHDRPQWRYVVGGSHQYIRKMLDGFSGELRCEADIDKVRRETGGVVLRFRSGEERRYDRVVLAAHADESLKLLADPSARERSLLGAWRYQENEAVLHTDPAVMPRSKTAWASWNFRGGESSPDAPVSVTYHMNRLQRLRTRKPYFVTLNGSGYAAEAVLDRTLFMHPLYSFGSLATQAPLAEGNGENRTYFCGSYFGFGFHEDAARSAVQVASRLGVEL